MSSPRRWRAMLVAALLFLFTGYIVLRNDAELMERYRTVTLRPLSPTYDDTPPQPHAPLGGGQGEGGEEEGGEEDEEGEGFDNEGEEESGGDHEVLRLKKLPDRYPVRVMKEMPVLPKEESDRVPPIQKRPAPEESPHAKEVRKQRMAEVREVFMHSWQGYKEHAWLSDEVMPLTGHPLKDVNKLGGWGATLVDALDTLWMMGLEEEFEEAVEACEQLDFSQTEGDIVNVFEVTIRYIGGFLGAYELSGKRHEVLLRKAVEVGEALLGAFDTPNRMPLAKWPWGPYARGGRQQLQNVEALEAVRAMPAAELGSLSLEFTKLTQLTGDGRFYDAVARIADVLDRHQLRTQLPGMWPVLVDAATPAFDTDDTFSLGGKSDSLYEYLPKQWLLLGGALDQPRTMYERFLPVAKKHLFRRVLNERNWPLVFSGDARVVEDPTTGRSVVNKPRGEHLTCFVGGMVGLAARAFGNAGNDGDVDLAAQLTDACVWSYNVTTTGIGPEKFFYATCGGMSEDPAGFRCSYTADKWRTALKKHWSFANVDDEAIDALMTNGRMAPGYVDMDDPKYMLRPEAIESVFIMWRLTGDPTWQEKAWHMFQSIAHYTGATAALASPDGVAPNGAVAAVGILDVTQENPEPMDKMESFWMGETLKYFYLVFADWDLVSLDEWVFNTEAHPFRRASLKKQK